MFRVHFALSQLFRTICLIPKSGWKKNLQISAKLTYFVAYYKRE